VETLWNSTRRSLSSHEDRDNRSGVTGFVKILQIQCVVPYLIHCDAVKSGLANLELHDEDHRTNEDEVVAILGRAMSWHIGGLPGSGLSQKTAGVHGVTLTMSWISIFGIVSRSWPAR
jgi:hypothetical protein